MSIYSTIHGFLYEFLGTDLLVFPLVVDFVTQFLVVCVMSLPFLVFWKIFKLFIP